MAWRRILSLCIIAVSVLHSVHAIVNFRISPTTYDIDGNNPATSLNFDCSPGSDFDQLFQTIIGRRTPGQEDQRIIKLTTNGLEWGQTNLQSRIPNPQIDTSAMSIRFNLQNPTCQDAGYTYYCSVTGNVNGNPDVQTQDVNITAQTRPRNIEMAVYQQRGEYDSGEYVTMTCSGSIGNAFENSDQYDRIFEWETRLLGTSQTSWREFEPRSNITVDGSPTPESNCQYRFRSVLHYTVTPADVYKQFRCKVSSDEYSANFTVTVKGQTTPRPGASGGGDTQNAGVNVGMIVGVVIGVLAVIVIVIVAVYFLVFRKRRDGDDYDTGEGKHDHPEMTDNVVYTTPASKQPHRGGKGRENEGLDEPQEKNPRGYYANDFGRANPAMDDEDYKHNRSYDDDNTDTRGGRPPYGSAV